VVFWPQESCKLGGGYFDEGLPILWLNIPRKQAHSDERDEHPFEIGFPAKPGQFTGTIKDRMRRDRWKVDRQSGTDKECSNFICWRKTRPGGGGWLRLVYTGGEDSINDETGELDPGLVRYEVEVQGMNPAVSPLKDVSWANWNSHGEVCYVKGSALFTARPEDPAATSRMVMDLGSLRPPKRVAPFTPIPLPGPKTQ
jgi:hypothetical protein